MSDATDDGVDTADGATAPDGGGADSTPDADGAGPVPDPDSNPDPVDASARLLRAVRVGDPVEERVTALATLDEASLTGLSVPARTAFWLNCYNAAAQLLLDTEPGLYDARRAFFGAEALPVAGQPLSLDDIEHGLLRGRSNYGFGYLPRLFASGFERRHRLPEVDPRVHFALNCGAESCPAVATYSRDADAELDDAAATYLDRTVEYEPDAGLRGRGVVRVPRVCLWFRRDFGGASGVRALLRGYDLLAADASPRVRYLDWDWSPRPRNFR